MSRKKKRPVSTEPPIKVIFLDFDGVLNNNVWIRERCAAGDQHLILTDVMPEHVSLLNQIIERSGAKVVISSSWRHHYGLFDNFSRTGRDSGDSLKAILERAGFKGELIGRTPDGWPGIRFSEQRLRGKEIQAWLDEWHSMGKPRVEAFVILDDSDDMAHMRDTNFVHTDEEKGLTQEDVEKALVILNAK